MKSGLRPSSSAKMQPTDHTSTAAVYLRGVQRVAARTVGERALDPPFAAPQQDPPPPVGEDEQLGCEVPARPDVRRHLPGHARPPVWRRRGTAPICRHARHLPRPAKVRDAHGAVGPATVQRSQAWCSLAAARSRRHGSPPPQQQVVRLEVAVDDTVRVRVAEPTQELKDDARGLLRQICRGSPG